jgi:hypothetical protein
VFCIAVFYLVVHIYTKKAVKLLMKVSAKPSKKAYGDRMDDIIKGRTAAVKDGIREVEKGVMKKPSSGNRRFDLADEEGDNRLGLCRDTQKAGTRFCIKTALNYVSNGLGEQSRRLVSNWKHWSF